MDDMSSEVPSYKVPQITTGSGDKKITIWDTVQAGRDKSVAPIHKLDAKSFGVTNALNMNHRHALLATAGSELVTSRHDKTSSS